MPKIKSIINENGDKRCNDCKDFKPITEFYQMSQKKTLVSGEIKCYTILSPYCKRCFILRVKKNPPTKQQNLERVLRHKNNLKLIGR